MHKFFLNCAAIAFAVGKGCPALAQDAAVDGSIMFTNVELFDGSPQGNLDHIAEPDSNLGVIPKNSLH